MPKGSWKEFDQNQINPKRDLFAKDLVPLKNRQVRVQKTKVGRGGKIVTLITGLGIGALEARQLLKTLKAACGTGGTMKDDVLELQGDKVSEALAVLEKKGFVPKKSGG